MRPTVLAAASLLLTSSLAPAQELQGREGRTFEWSERIASGSWFRFYTPIGDVTITEGSGERVQLRAEKILRDDRAEDIAFVVLRDRDGVTICAVHEDADECDEDGINRRGWRYSSSRRRSTLNVTITIPRGLRIRSNSGNGDVSLSAAASEAHVGSGNGRVRVASVTGPVEASSGNGQVDVERAGGPVRASSGNGDVSVTTSVGPVNASSGNGDVMVSMDVLRGEEDMEFSSGNGRIILTVPGDFGGEIQASTGNGRFSTDFPMTIAGRISPSRVRGTIGSSRRRVEMSSGNGNIEIRRASAR
jgi:DUF4097 and DUF4098 domain-containing protein YvlB